MSRAIWTNRSQMKRGEKAGPASAGVDPSGIKSYKAMLEQVTGEIKDVEQQMQQAGANYDKISENVQKMQAEITAALKAFNKEMTEFKPVEQRRIAGDITVLKNPAAGPRSTSLKDKQRARQVHRFGQRGETLPRAGTAAAELQPDRLPKQEFDASKLNLANYNHRVGGATEELMSLYGNEAKQITPKERADKTVLKG